MFVDFFYHLRARGLKVSVTEFLTLLEALGQGHAHTSLERFYGLARAILVKRPEHYDLYDMAFAEFFANGAWDPTKLPGLTDELLDWLQDPLNMPELSPEELAKLQEAIDLEELRKGLEERLRDQDARHDGGNHWIGTGGTSPYGHSGAARPGIRVGGQGKNRSAVAVAQERRFKNLRDDLTLDVRQFQTALRKLRVLTRDGREEELDLDATVDATAKNYGDIELVFSKPRKNQVKLLLLSDVGGSMNPYAHLTSLLFSAAHQANHFKAFRSYYFHNCPYGTLYSDMARREGEPTQKVLDGLDPEWRCIILGDAAMAPYELTDPGGSIDLYYTNRKSGLHWLQAIRQALPRSVWLNPDRPRYWEATYTTRVIAQVFPMFPLTLAGLDDAVRELRKRGGA